MKGTTHAPIGAVVAVITGQTLGASITELVYCAGIGFLAGLLPDIDQTNSKIQEFIPLGAGKILGYILPHRGITHSILFSIIITGLVGTVKFLPHWAAPCFLAGIISHLILDAMNPKGVRLAYPVSIKTYRFPIAITSGGSLDMLIITPLSWLALIYVFSKALI